MGIKDAVAERFLELCAERKIRPNELAARAGVTPSTVYSMLDPRRRDVSVVTVKKLCDGLNLTIGEFFSTERFDALEQETVARYGELPEEARNYFGKARLKALANERHIQSISLAAGKLSIEPVRKPEGELWERLRRVKARYVPSASKLQVPLKFFELPEDGSLIDAAFDFLSEL